MATLQTANPPRTMLPGEVELQRWAGLMLTTHRLMLLSAGSTSSLTSLLLRDLEWSRVGRTHQPLLVVLSALAGLAGVFMLGNNASFGVALLVVALVALLIYAAGRRATMIFAAGDGRIEVALGGDAKSWDSAKIFANAVEHAALRTAPLS